MAAARGSLRAEPTPARKDSRSASVRSPPGRTPRRSRRSSNSSIPVTAAVSAASEDVHEFLIQRDRAHGDGRFAGELLGPARQIQRAALKLGLPEAALRTMEQIDACGGQEAQGSVSSSAGFALIWRYSLAASTARSGDRPETPGSPCCGFRGSPPPRNGCERADHRRSRRYGDWSPPRRTGPEDSRARRESPRHRNPDARPIAAASPKARITSSISCCVIGSVIFSPALAKSGRTHCARTGRFHPQARRQTHVPELGKDFAAGVMNFLNHPLPACQGFFAVEVRHVGIEARCQDAERKSLRSRSGRRRLRPGGDNRPPLPGPGRRLATWSASSAPSRSGLIRPGS